MDDQLRARAAAAMNDGLAALERRDYQSACAGFDLALPLIRQLGFLESEAAALYNLGLCRARMRQPAAARAALEASVALRDANPGWDRYYLVEARGWLARALAEVGEIDAADRMLAGIWLEILQKAGEGSVLFGETLVHQAFLEHARGDQMRAEAMLRRAHYLLDAIGAGGRAEDAFGDQVRLVAAARPGPPARLARDRLVAVVELSHTLMRWQPHERGFAGSGDLPKTWFFSLPAAWRGDDLDARARPVLVRIFADGNLRLNSSEPADAGYLEVTGHRCRILDDGEIAGRPWNETAVVWEPSTVYLVEERWAMPLGRNEIEALVGGGPEPTLARLEAEAHAPPP
ncbi:MAG TPA: hypothetical protein VIG06_05915 [Kofleriaceae bacterium]